MGGLPFFSFLFSYASVLNTCIFTYMYMYTIWQTCTCILLSCLDHVHACIHCTCIYVSPYQKKPHVKKARASVCMVHVRTYGHRWCHSPQASSPCCFISNQVSPCFSCYFFLCACLDCRTREDLEMRHMIRNQTMKFRLLVYIFMYKPIHFND